MSSIKVDKSKGVTVDNKGSGYPPTFNTEKKDKTSASGDKNPYAEYFSKRKDLKNNGKKKVKKDLLGRPMEARRILKKGWIEEVN